MSAIKQGAHVIVGWTPQGATAGSWLGVVTSKEPYAGLWDVLRDDGAVFPVEERHLLAVRM